MLYGIVSKNFVYRYFERHYVHPVATSGSTVCVGDGYMYLFGGHARLGNVNNLYRLDLNNLEWEKIVPRSENANELPSPRDKAVSWYHHRKLVWNLTHDEFVISKSNKNSKCCYKLITQSFYLKNYWCHFLILISYHIPEIVNKWV